MRRNLLAGSVLALLAACGSQPEEPASQDADVAAPADAAAQAQDAAAVMPGGESGHAPAPSAAGVDPASLAKGDMVEVITSAQCFEVGPDADDTPWDMYPGVSKEVLAVEGDKLRVMVGDTECLLPTANVKRS